MRHRKRSESRKSWEVYRYLGNRRVKCNLYFRYGSMMDETGVLLHFRDLDFLNIGKGTNGLLKSELAIHKSNDTFFSLITLRGDFDFEAKNPAERLQIIMDILQESGFRKMKWLPKKLGEARPGDQFRLSLTPTNLNFGPLNHLSVIDVLADVE